MPPKGGQGHWRDRVLDDSDIERTAEYEEFMQRLQDYHDKRGTVLQREPELGRKKLDLLKLYKRITSLGGYDHCTTEKGAWRDIAQSYKLAANNTNAGYLLKTIYYKNLAAYEISNFFGEDPPPKDILEDRSAAGGPIRGRTLENFKDKSPSAEPPEEKSASPQTSQPVSSVSSSGRTLRQAPPQRQFYQPPLSTPRASKMTSTNAIANNQPQSLPQQHSAIQNQSMVGMHMTTWTPPNLVPSYPAGISLGPIPLPITTSDNISQSYAQQIKERQIVAPIIPKYGVGHTGPNSMTRIVMGLKSGLSDEVEYALQNLVRLSYEWGDGLKSETFPGMTEALIDELSHISKSKDALAHLKSHSQALVTIDAVDTMETKEGRRRLDRVLETALILRNMSIHVENAKYMARFRKLIDTLIHGITLPGRPHLVELKHYCLDIAEALSSHLPVMENEDLYTALKMGLASDDRSILMSSIRAITRLVGRDETNRLSDIDSKHIQRIQDLLTLEDDDLVSTCLDFLYSYTAVDENVSKLMSWADATQFLKQLKRLLLHQAQEYLNEYQLRPKRKDPIPAHIPNLPPEIITELLSFPEPERATKWMRCCFEEDAEADITQIALWQAYQARFTEFVPKGRPLLPAADFIKNVSVAFTQASAMVIPVQQGPQGPSQKFIIKGIKPRATPLSPKGIEYLACKWNINQTSQIVQCPSQLPTPNDLFAHILDVHLKPPPTGTPVTPLTCSWAGCSRFPPPGIMDRRQLIAHVRTHMPDKSLVKNKSLNAPLLTPEDLPENRVIVRRAPTAVDERGEPAGLALTAALVLRNIARAAAASSSSNEELEQRKRSAGLSGKKDTIWDLGGLEEDLHGIATLNQSLAEYIYDLLMVRWEIEDLENPPPAQIITPIASSLTPSVGVGYGIGGAPMAIGLPQMPFTIPSQIPMGISPQHYGPQTYAGIPINVPLQVPSQLSYGVMPQQIPPPQVSQMAMPHPQQPKIHVPHVPPPPPVGGTRLQL